jgi:hypothetical protein
MMVIRDNVFEVNVVTSFGALLAAYTAVGARNVISMVLSANMNDFIVNHKTNKWSVY